MYNTPITIDDKDVLYGNDFVEEETPVDMTFYKTGIIKKELNYKTTTGYNPKDFIEV